MNLNFVLKEDDEVKNDANFGDIVFQNRGYKGFVINYTS